MTNFTGTAGNDTIDGTSGNDRFDLTQGGIDKVQGEAGNDTFVFGATLTAADRIDGGTSGDAVTLNGDYSAGLVFQAATMVNVERIVLAAGHSYNLTTANQTVAAGAALKVDGSALALGQTLTFDGSKEKDGHFLIIGGADNDLLTGGSGNDTFDLTKGDCDVANGNAGNDTFIFGSTFDTTDKVNGGTGTNIITLDGDYSGGFVVAADQITSIATMTLGGGFTYNLTFGAGVGQPSTIDGSAAGQIIIDAEGTGNAKPVLVIGSAGNDTVTGASTFDGGDGDDTFIAGSTAVGFNGGSGHDVWEMTTGGLYALAAKTTGVEEMDLMASNQNYTITMAFQAFAGNPGLTIDGHLLDASHSVTITPHNSGDGAAPQSAIGGAGNDVLEAQGGILEGNGGADHLSGGFAEDQAHDDVAVGTETFVYNTVSDSTSTAYDTLSWFDPSHDMFQMPTAVSAVDTAVTTGALSTASFDTDLAAAIGAGQLGAGHAVVFTPNSGTLAGDHFLIVDANGTAGYQAGADYVMLLDGTSGTDVSTSNFTTPV
jgi:hypothetical protein